MRLNNNITQVQTVTTSVNLAAIDLATIDTFSMQLVLSANSSSDASFKLQVSNDGINYVDVAGSTIAAVANGTHMLHIARLDNLHVRGVFTATTGTIVGTLIWVFRQSNP